MEEKQCEICLEWKETNKFHGNICRTCIEKLRQMPEFVPTEYKEQTLKNVKLNNQADQYSHLSRSDKAVFLRCLKCEWLREIDYLNLKIYCSQPKCIKRGDEYV